MFYEELQSKRKMQSAYILNTIENLPPVEVWITTWGRTEQSVYLRL